MYYSHGVVIDQSQRRNYYRGRNKMFPFSIPSLVRKLKQYSTRQELYIFMEQQDVVLELFTSVGKSQRVTSPDAYVFRHLALRTNDVQSVREKLTSAGYDLEPIRTDTFNGRKLFFVKDPDGLPIEMHE